jgi:formylglycine-generating enzyme required for sulfatase activity
MRKEPQNRYQTAIHLEEDIKRYLANQPLDAAPESRVYRLRKWVRRNKTGMKITLVGVLMLVLGVSIPPLKAKWDDMHEIARMNAFEVLAQDPDPAVVTDVAARERIRATGKPWKIRHTLSGIVMLLCPPGEFMMGWPEGQSETIRGYDEQRRQMIPQPFYLSQTEVSKSQWRAMTGEEPGFFRGDDLPVEQVTWSRVQSGFIGASRGAFRLPSSAEWEYACRAGTTTDYSFGDKVSGEQANIFSRGPVACGSLPSNPWGFHEMHGNVREWVEDSDVDLVRQTLDASESRVWLNRDPKYRLLRGGCWARGGIAQRSYDREFESPGFTDKTIGFRVAR